MIFELFFIGYALIVVADITGYVSKYHIETYQQHEKMYRR